MTIPSTRIKSVKSVFLVSLVVWVTAAFGPIGQTVEAQQPYSGKEKTWTESISSGFKKGIEKVGGKGQSKPQHHVYGAKDDPVALSNKSKPGPELYVAVARLYEESGNTTDAMSQYLAALELKDDYLPALLGYARLEERAGRIDEAMRIYRYAIKTNPKQTAPALNNMALCYARSGRVDEAIAALSEAVKSDPKNPLYRNNIATLLIDRNRFREAFAHLRNVHSEAASYYNMGYMLNKKGQTEAALQHFVRALQVDPQLVQARQWIEHLQRETSLARRPRRTEVGDNPNGSENATRPDPKVERAPPLGHKPPKRLPPTAANDSDWKEAPLPETDQRRSSPPPAPLPPTNDKPSIRPLPRVD
ncbi:MAG: tetratricopeptide repeat protein [Pirellulales bacterium]|nr:tetratricopeptide repeat protein [Pirellulales bacterium]